MDYAKRAQSFVGTRFRPQGRSADAVDCVGLACLTYDIPPGEVRRDYRLKGNHFAELQAGLAGWFRRVRHSDVRPGDLLLFAAAPEQQHLAVKTAAGVVHAHAGLRRVVETPGFPEWPVIGSYRKRIRPRRP